MNGCGCWWRYMLVNFVYISKVLLKNVLFLFISCLTTVRTHKIKRFFDRSVGTYETCVRAFGKQIVFVIED